MRYGSQTKQHNEFYDLLAFPLFQQHDGHFLFLANGKKSLLSLKFFKHILANASRLTTVNLCRLSSTECNLGVYLALQSTLWLVNLTICSLTPLTFLSWLSLLNRFLLHLGWVPTWCWISSSLRFSAGLFSLHRRQTATCLPPSFSLCHIPCFKNADFPKALFILERWKHNGCLGYQSPLYPSNTVQ